MKRVQPSPPCQNNRRKSCPPSRWRFTRISRNIVHAGTANDSHLGGHLGCGAYSPAFPGGVNVDAE